MRAGLLPVGHECMSRDQATAIQEMLRILAILDPDRARIRNGAGFSKADTSEGCRLASLPNLNRDQLLTAKWILRKYYRQLDPDLYRMVYPETDIYDDDPAA